MLMLEDVRDLVSGLGFTEDHNVYMGKLDAKQDKSIGVYNLKRSAPYTVAIGGKDKESYRTKQISILVHWNRSMRDTEAVGAELFEKLAAMREVRINEKQIKFIHPLVDQPVDVGTDDNGIYEMVIEIELIYERKGD
ncbi:MAG: hypothetical protein RHS_6076 [Robinsoniella sp. RHS]|uniref:minor capsid protein n=1 Tax=Robinsoniella sp. RHS TaxID=1504536 RepID=UPI00064B7B48|nr:MAG: hypothetical protein RHS_6076 [Robinsoniella sp. RHS]